jgi:glycosyltransferase involved in cell wall biosynthesis
MRRGPLETTPVCRVAHLVEDLQIGGLEKVIAMIAAGLDRRRFAPEVWCLVRGGPVADWIARAGTPVRVLGLRSYHNPLNVLKLAVRLRAAGVAIVHTHGYFAGTFGRLAAFAAGITRVFCHVHTANIDFCRRERLVDRCLARVTRKVICVSRSVQRFVEQEEGVPPRKTCVIYNAPFPACAGDGRAAGRPSAGERQAGPLVVAVGSLVRNKGHHVLLEAMRRVSSELPEMRLVIAGGGPERAALEDQIGRAGLAGRVTLAGVVERVEALLARADIFVLPSVYREGLSLALLEAMSFGLPVIASRIGGIPEVVVDGTTGILVPPGDSASLAAAVRRLANDPQEGARMGRRGRARIARVFSREKMIAEIEALYASA